MDLSNPSRNVVTVRTSTPQVLVLRIDDMQGLHVDRILLAGCCDPNLILSRVSNMHLMLLLLLIVIDALRGLRSAMSIA